MTVPAARRLPLEVMLQVFERCDLHTVRTLYNMPEFHEALHLHRKSVLQNMHRNRDVPTIAPGTSKAVLAYRYIYGQDNDDSTKDAVCLVLPVDDVSSLAEVEERERKIDILLKAPFLRIQPGPSGKNFTWPRLSGEPRMVFRAMMKRALHLCDAIQDFEAQAAMDLGVSVSAYLYRPCPNAASPCIPSSPPPAPEPCDDEDEAQEDALEDLAGADGTTIEGQRRLHQVVVPNRARRLQNDFIRTLQTEDLMAIRMLVHVSDTSWVEARRVSRYNTPRRLAFQENVLRRGSCFLYCDVRGYGERAKHTREMVDECSGILGMIDDKNNHLLPPLLTTLSAELCTRLGVTMGELDATILGRVEKLLHSQEPVFAMHPTTQERGVDPLY